MASSTDGTLDKNIAPQLTHNVAGVSDVAAKSVPRDETTDEIFDFECSRCNDDSFKTKAEYSCPECKLYYCTKCSTLHATLFKRHEVIGRGAIEKWQRYGGDGEPADWHDEDPAVMLVLCDDHTDKTIELFCEDHKHLCCNMCVSLSHRQCKSIVKITDAARNIRNDPGFKGFLNNLSRLLKQIQIMKDKKTSSQHGLDDSCNNALSNIRGIRKELNEKLDEMEKEAIKNLEKMKKSLHDGMANDIEECSEMHGTLCYFYNKLKETKDDDSASFIGMKKCTSAMATVVESLQDMWKGRPSTVTFQADHKVQEILTENNCIGRIETNFAAGEKKAYNITGKDSTTYNSICELPDGQFLVAGYTLEQTVKFNITVNLLDSNFEFKASCKLKNSANHRFTYMCGINDENKAIVANGKDIFAVSAEEGMFFYRKTLIMNKLFELHHSFRTMAYSQRCLYFGYQSDICIYTLYGHLVKNISLRTYMIRHLAMTGDASRIYIATCDNRIITLNNDFEVISIIKDDGLARPELIHVSRNGYVFVINNETTANYEKGNQNKHILTKSIATAHGLVQIDREGRHILGTIFAIKEEEREVPLYFTFNDKNSCLTVLKEKSENKENVVVFKLHKESSV